VALGGILVNADASLLEVGDCDGSLPVSIAATPESVELLEDAATILEDSGAEVDGDCVDYRVRESPPTEVARSLDARAAHPADLWVPDSSFWLDRVDGFEREAKVVDPSLARSPVVVAGRQLSGPRSWRDVLSRTDVTFVDPQHSSAPAAALLALRAESDSTEGAAPDSDAVMVPLAQRLGGDRDAPRDLTDLALDPGGAAILSEQQLLDLRAHGLGRDLDAQVPRTGTIVLDYPLVGLTQDDARLEAAEHLASYLAGAEGAALLETAGFRLADLAPLPFDRGAGELARVLPTPRADVVADVLRRWSVLTVPTRVLGVFDVSGSMDELAGGQTRAALAAEASAGALRMFPEQTRIGMWAFSDGLGGKGRDHRNLVTTRRLDARSGGVSQRQLLSRALARLPYLTNGGTGLYDTTLAAVRAVLADYDKGAVNTVVLLTDGRNEDPGSISQRRLLRILERERDPSRPVTVIAIGVGPDADAASLRRIVAATGGRSYLARNPTDIGRVFKNALLSR
jgi:hypothetical protein